jgi:outer membrane protein insertion porin family
MLQAALFVDAGQAWNSYSGTPPRMKVAYGAGLRLDTPLGIMRLDYGIGEKGGGTFFSIGPSF